MIDIEDTPIGFGKYADKTPNEVAEIDPGYIIWLNDEAGRTDLVSDEMYDACHDLLDDDDDWGLEPLDF